MYSYVDPVAIQSLWTQSPFIHNNEESEYFQHPSTVSTIIYYCYTIVIVFAIQFLQGTHRNSSPPPPPIFPPDYNETEFSHPYTVTEDIHESSTTFVSQELLAPTQDTSTTNESTDNVSIVIHTIIIIVIIVLPKAIVRVPEGPKHITDNNEDDFQYRDAVR